MRNKLRPLDPIFNVDKRVGEILVGVTPGTVPPPPPPDLVVIDVLTDATNLNGARGLAISGDHLFVACQSLSGVASVDISDPTNMSLADTVTDASMNTTQYIYISGSHAFVTGAGTDSVVSIDISDPTNMSLADSLSDAAFDNTLDIVGSGNYVYASRRTSAFSVSSVDISTPTALAIADTLVTASGAQYFAISGDVLYALGATTIYSIDISDPTNMSIRDTFTDGAFNSLTKPSIGAGHLFVGDLNIGSLHAIDISDPDNLALVSTLPQTAFEFDGVFQAFYRDSYVFTAALFDDSVSAIDVSDPSNMVLVDTVNVYGAAFGPGVLVVTADHIFTSGNVVHAVAALTY